MEGVIFSNPSKRKRPDFEEPSTTSPRSESKKNCRWDSSGDPAVPDAGFLCSPDNMPDETQQFPRWSAGEAEPNWDHVRDDLIEALNWDLGPYSVSGRYRGYARGGPEHSFWYYTHDLYTSNFGIRQPPARFVEVTESLWYRVWNVLIEALYRDLGRPGAPINHPSPFIKRGAQHTFWLTTYKKYLRYFEIAGFMRRRGSSPIED